MNQNIKTILIIVLVAANTGMGLLFAGKSFSAHMEARINARMDTQLTKILEAYKNEQDELATLGATIASTSPSNTLSTFLSNVNTNFANINDVLAATTSANVFSGVQTFSDSILGSSTIVIDGALTVGADVSGTAIDRIFTGICTLEGGIGIAATTTSFVHCSGATNVTAGDRVFLSATSSLAEDIVIQAASSTAGAIGTRLLNMGIASGTAYTWDATGSGAPASLEYWAVR